MNTTKKIAVVLAVLIVAAAMAAPAVMGGETGEAIYTVTVLTGQDTSIGAVNGAFGDILKGKSEEITASFTLTNGGDWDANVSAKFSTSEGITYGMPSTETGDGDVIPGTAFKLGPDSSELALKDTNDDTYIGTVTKGGGTMICDAILEVPGTQSAEAYSGTILLTFSNA